jgi:hypothetical protein
VEAPLGTKSRLGWCFHPRLKNPHPTIALFLPLSLIIFLITLLSTTTLFYFLFIFSSLSPLLVAQVDRGGKERVCAVANVDDSMSATGRSYYSVGYVCIVGLASEHKRDLRGRGWQRYTSKIPKKTFQRSNKVRTSDIVSELLTGQEIFMLSYKAKTKLPILYESKVEYRC